MQYAFYSFIHYLAQLIILIGKFYVSFKTWSKYDDLYLILLIEIALKFLFENGKIFKRKLICLHVFGVENNINVKARVLIVMTL